MSRNTRKSKENEFTLVCYSQLFRPLFATHFYAAGAGILAALSCQNQGTVSVSFIPNGYLTTFQRTK